MAGDSVRGIRDELCHSYGFSPAKAEAYLDMLEDFPSLQVAQGRKHGEVVYYAAAADEPPDKPLAKFSYFRFLLLFGFL